MTSKLLTWHAVVAECQVLQHQNQVIQGGHDTLYSVFDECNLLGWNLEHGTWQKTKCYVLCRSSCSDPLPFTFGTLDTFDAFDTFAINFMNLSKTYIQVQKQETHKNFKLDETKETCLHTIIHYVVVKC